MQENFLSKMRALVFDAGPIISLTMNNLLWVLPKLKERFDGEFYITSAVKNEIIDFPLTTKKYKFEAIQVMELLNSGTLKVIDNDFIRDNTPLMLETANSIFRAHEHYISILHYAEVSVISATSSLNADVMAIDEKTTRLLIEDHQKLKYILTKTLHTNIYINADNLNRFKEFVGGIKIIRSVEVITRAYELGILNRYITNYPNSSKQLIEAVLWGAKLDGCAVSENEIRQIIKLEAK